MAIKNLKQAILNLSGEPVRQLVVDPAGGHKTDAEGNVQKDANGNPLPATIEKELVASELITTALLQPYNDEPGLSADEKVKRFKMAEKIHANPEAVDLALEDCVTLKAIVAKLYAPLVVGRIVAILEG